MILKAATAAVFVGVALFLLLRALKRRGHVPDVKHYSPRAKWLLVAFIFLALVLFPIFQYYAAYR